MPILTMPSKSLFRTDAARTGGHFPNHHERKQATTAAPTEDDPCRELTYAELVAEIAASSLTALEWICITDFRTIYAQEATGTVLQGVLEPLVVRASSSNSLYEDAWSSLFEDDVIRYVVQPTAGYLGATATSRGVINYRWNKTFDCSAHFDFRTIMFPRDIDAQGRPANFTPAGAPAYQSLAFGVPGVDSANVHLGAISPLAVFLGAPTAQWNNIVFDEGAFNVNVAEDNWNWQLTFANALNVYGSYNSIIDVFNSDDWDFARNTFGHSNVVDMVSELSDVDFNHSNRIVTRHANAAMTALQVNVNNQILFQNAARQGGSSGLIMDNDNILNGNSNTDITRVKMFISNDCTANLSGTGQFNNSEFLIDNTIIFTEDNASFALNYFESNWEMTIQAEFQNNRLKTPDGNFISLLVGPIVTPNQPINDRRIEPGFSNFEYLANGAPSTGLDISGVATIDYLTDDPNQYLFMCGIIHLVTTNAGTPAETITTILNGDTQFPRRFLFNDHAKSIRFVDNSVSAVGVNSIQLDATPLDIIGNNTHLSTDYIEFWGTNAGDPGPNALKNHKNYLS